MTVEASSPTAALVVAGGRGVRVGESRPKQFLSLGGRPVLDWSIDVFLAHRAFTTVVVVLPASVAHEPPPWLRSRVEAGDGRLRLVPGGSSRPESVVAGLEDVGEPRVLIHDGVRPLVARALVERVLQSGADAVVPVVDVADTIKEISPDGWVERTLERSRLGAAQTPQAFDVGILRDLLSRDPALDWTDEAALCERHGVQVATVAGDPGNFKITRPEDLAYARWLVSQ